jgi:hypothetical protein
MAGWTTARADLIRLAGKALLQQSHCFAIITGNGNSGIVF